MNAQATYRTINDVPAAVKAEWQKAGMKEHLLTFANARAKRLADMWFNRRDKNRTH